MDTFEVIKGRRSIRSFRDVDIGKEKVRKLLKAANWAPSGGNNPEWKIYPVNEELVKKVDKFSPGLYGEPPVVLVICLDEEDSGEGKYSKTVSYMDIGIVAQNICLQATSMDLGTCIVRSFNKKAIKKILDLPSNLSPELMVSIGVPEKVPDTPQKRSLDNAVDWSGWEDG